MISISAPALAQAPATAAPVTAAPATAAPATAAPAQTTLASCCSNKALNATCRNNILQDCTGGASECRIRKPGMAPIFNAWWPQGRCVAGQAYCTLSCVSVH